MHYCFFSTGSWEQNASMVRPRELGRAMIERGVKVTFIVDDVPYNREHLNLPPGANVVYVPEPGSLKQFPRRRRIIRELAPDFVHFVNPAAKSSAALIGSRTRVVGDWDEWIAHRDYPLM